MTRRASAIDFKNLLFALDFSKEARGAIRYVRRLQRHYSATVYVANVLDLFPYDRRNDETAVVAIATLRKHANLHLRDLLQRHSLDEKRFPPIILEGDVVEAIKAGVRKHAIDLVILASQGRVGPSRLFRGSISEEIFRTVSCPVLTIGPEASAHQGDAALRHVLFATDLGKYSKSALPYIQFLLKMNPSSDLTLAHFLRSGATPSYEQYRIRTQTEATLRELLPVSLRKRVAGTVVESLPAAEGILEVSRSMGANLIVLGVRRGGALARLATHGLRSITYRVVAQATCPVLTIRS